MVCRHEKGDPNCSSSANYLYRESYNDSLPKTPDASQYSIEDVMRVGQHLVVKAKYPNCAKCHYEGIKIMVFLDVSEKQVLMWKKIDPHFRNVKPLATEAPSPAARFPGSAEGWQDAINYATSKVKGYR